MEITSVKDTLVADYECKKLHKYRETYNYLVFEHLYEDLGDEIIRSDDDKVYIYRNGLFYTLYDFSAQTGDIWNIPYTYEAPDCDTIGSVEVTSIGDTIIQGENLRYIVVEPIENSAWNLYGTIIEKIGPVELYFFPEQMCTVDFFEGGAFRCFDNGVIHIESGPYACEYVTVSTSDLAVKNLNCFPNPANSQFTFELPAINKEGSIHIKDINGKSIAELSLNQNQTQLVWDCSQVAPGVYFYQTTIDEVVFRGKIIIGN